jgi:site-specific DNA recombinase
VSTEPSLRFAFYGRVSTEDNQDPTLSLPRQLRSCTEGVERLSGEIVAHYYDVESGSSGMGVRGNVGKLSGFEIPIPRDGGLPELIEEARSGRFEVVVCESINRFARNSAVTFRCEEELRDAGVKLWAADETAYE